MTKEEAWLVWINATKTTDTPIETDFEVIKKTSWWAAFSAGWDAAAVNLNGWDNAYMMGVQAGKEIAQPEHEPVAYYYESSPGKRGVSLYKETEQWQPLYTAPPSIEAAVLAERDACAEWLRDNYQDYKNIADICEAILARGKK